MADALLELEEELLDGALRVVVSSVLCKLGAVKENGNVLPCTCSRTSIKSSSDNDFNLLKAEADVGNLRFANKWYTHANMRVMHQQVDGRQQIPCQLLLQR